MKTLKDIALLLGPELGDVREYIRKALNDHAENKTLEKILSESMEAPGKMVRPVVLFLAAGEYDKERRDELIASAAAAEIMHTATLILDDFIDRSDMRRGRKTVYAEYGDNVAVLAGDYLLIRAFSYLFEKGYTYEAGVIMSVCHKACDGEMFQHDNLRNTSVGIEDYLTAIRGKTALFFRGMCQMACHITDKDERTSALYEEFGETLGMMFQIRDDLLDWQGRTEDIGKPAHEDFSEGIYTMPAIYTFSTAGYGEKLKDIACKESLSDEDIKEAVRLVKDSGGIARTEEYIEGLRKKADDLISALPPDRYTEALKKMVEYCSKPVAG